MSLYRLYFEDNTCVVPMLPGRCVIVIQDARFRSGHKDPPLRFQSQSILKEHINIVFQSKIDTATVDIELIHSPGNLPIRSKWTLVRHPEHVTITVEMVDKLFVPDSTMIMTKTSLL